MRTVLCVEDDPDNRELIGHLLTQRGDIHLLTAEDGTLGIECARARHPEVILMDVSLPGISGVEAMRILRADPQTAHIPVIALSGNAMPKDVEAGLNAGFFAYITKPIDFDLFMATLDAALTFASADLDADTAAAEGRLP